MKIKLKLNTIFLISIFFISSWGTAPSAQASAEQCLDKGSSLKNSSIQNEISSQFESGYLGTKSSPPNGVLGFHEMKFGEVVNPKYKNMSAQNYSGLDSKIDLLDLGPNERYAFKLYARLAGSSISATSPVFKKLVKLIKSKKFQEASALITEQEKFLQVRVRNFAAPFSSKTFTNNEPFNDLQALILGVVRDELDARMILTGDISYRGSSNYDLPAVSLDNNDHYLKFDDLNLKYQTDLERVDHQWENFESAAGALTTRAWAKVSYDAGTNRRSVRNSIDAFLCVPIDSWKTRAVPDVFVRRDVDRAPGGNPSTFQNTCRSCHAIMDGMGGAFAKMDFVNSTFLYSKDSVVAKMNQNSAVYPQGFVTTDDSFTNLLGYNSALDFGWRTEMHGDGIQEFANMLAQSEAYSRCLVQKVFSEVCGLPIGEADPKLLPDLVKQFEADQRNLKHLFAQVAVQEQCLPYPQEQK